MRTTTTFCVWAAICAVLVLAAYPAQGGTLVRLENPGTRALLSTGFELERDARINVEAVGLGGEGKGDLFAYGWILDADNRELVWSLDDTRTKRAADTKSLRRAEGELDLEAGKYEVYLWGGTPWQGVNLAWLGRLGSFPWAWDWDEEEWEEWEEELEEELREHRHDLRDLEKHMRKYERDVREREESEWDWGAEEDDRDMSRRERQLRERERELEKRERELEERQRELEEQMRELKESERERKMEHRSEFEGLLEQCYIELSSERLTAADIRTYEVTGNVADALVQLNRVGDSELRSTGFTLDRPMSVRIYALIEYVKGTASPADFAWIVNADSRELVWHPRKSDLERAGGANKNRFVKDVVKLEAGDYVLYYGTDDSHSYEEWNASPPWDAPNWGVGLFPGRDFSAAAFRTFEPRGPGESLIDLTKAGDSDLLKQPFKLGRDTDLYVRALGEYDDRNNEFVDYGWIADAKTGEEVWTMSRRNTMPAGGADKNRMFDGTVHLEAGDYIAYYVTDDSHSYEEWNSATPFQPDAWGMAIYPGRGMRASDLRTLESSELPQDPKVIVKMVMVGDSERRRDRFTLDRPVDVRIIALGEGLGGSMYDYGYIEDDDTGEIVWEMTYEESKYAGGAKKNRVFDGVVRLDAGNYRAYYVTDDSHSFPAWNDDKPREPSMWGLTVMLAE